MQYVDVNGAKLMRSRQRGGPNPTLCRTIASPHSVSQPFSCITRHRWTVSEEEHLTTEKALATAEVAASNWTPYNLATFMGTMRSQHQLQVHNMLLTDWCCCVGGVRLVVFGDSLPQLYREHPRETSLAAAGRSHAMNVFRKVRRIIFRGVILQSMASLSHNYCFCSYISAANTFASSQNSFSCARITILFSDRQSGVLPLFPGG